jgi:hypothetical protein
MRIDFEFDTAHGVFRDALHFEDDAVPTAAEIEALKQERLAGWIATLEAWRQAAEQREAEQAARAEARRRRVRPVNWAAANAEEPVIDNTQEV